LVAAAEDFCAAAFGADLAAGFAAAFVAVDVDAAETFTADFAAAFVTAGLDAGDTFAAGFFTGGLAAAEDCVVAGFFTAAGFAAAADVEDLRGD
jgi:hypothetical protein